MTQQKLKPCRFCGEREQLEIRGVDAKNPDRDLIRCRMCYGQAPRKWWNTPDPAVEKLVEALKEIAIGHVSLMDIQDAVRRSLRDWEESQNG